LANIYGPNNDDYSIQQLANNQDIR